MTRIRNISLMILFLIVAACGDSGQTGSLTLRVADSPVDIANRVVVRFTGVEVKPAVGNSVSFEFEDAKEIDLLSLQGGESAIILNGVTLDAGRYNWIRLAVEAEKGVLDSYIELSDLSIKSLWVPSGDESGLKLNRGFTVPAGGTADFTIDFDLRKSVHNPEGSFDDYILRPTLRIVDNVEVGSIEGTVHQSLLNPEGGNAVYVYEGEGATPNDVGGSPEPINTAIVDMETGNYEAAFMLEGIYTIAFTNQASADTPLTDDDINFVGTANVNVIKGESAAYNFAP